MITASALIRKLLTCDPDAIVLVTFVRDEEDGWVSEDVMDIKVINNHVHIVGEGDGTEG